MTRWRRSTRSCGGSRRSKVARTTSRKRTCGWESPTRSRTPRNRPAYLDTLGGTVSYLKGDRATSRAAAQKALAREPSFGTAHQLLLKLALEAKDHAETARLLRGYEPYAPPGAIAGFLSAPEFADFVRSDEHKRWAAERR